MIAKGLIVLCRTEHNFKTCCTSYWGPTLTVMVLTAGKFSHRKIKARFLTFPSGCESSRFMFWHLCCLYSALLSYVFVRKGQWDFCMNSASNTQIFSPCFVWQYQKSWLDLVVSHLACFIFLPCRIWHHFVLLTSYIMPSHFSSWSSAPIHISKLLTFIFSSFLCTDHSCS